MLFVLQDKEELEERIVENESGNLSELVLIKETLEAAQKQRLIIHFTRPLKQS